MKALLLLLIAGAAHGQEFAKLATTDGKSYEQAKVTAKTPEGISITHSAGTARIDFMRLPEDVRASLGFDRQAYDAAKAASKAGAEKRAEAAKLEAEAVIIQGGVMQVIDGGFLSSNPFEGVRIPQRAQSRFRYGRFFIHGHPDQKKLVDGQAFAVKAVEDGIYKYQSVTGAEATVKRYRVLSVVDPTKRK